MNSIHSGRGWPMTCGYSGGCRDAAEGTTVSALMGILGCEWGWGAGSPRKWPENHRRPRPRQCERLRGGARRSMDFPWAAAACAAPAARCPLPTLRRADAGTHLEQLREEGQLQRLLQEAHAAGAAG